MPQSPSDGKPQLPAPRVGINPFAILINIGKTIRLLGAILIDARVSIFRKLIFLSSIGILIGLLIAGDAATELMSAILPVIGPALNIPIDASLDWVAIAMAAFSLLRIFPAAIVGEHYDRLFRNGRQARARVAQSAQTTLPPAP